MGKENKASTRASGAQSEDGLSAINETIKEMLTRLDKLDIIERQNKGLTRDMTDLRKASEKLNVDKLLKTLEDMKKLLAEKDFKITELEKRVEDLEQYTRREDIIITGLKIVRPLSQVVQGDSANEIDRNGWNYVEDQVTEQLNENGIYIRPEEISACHTLGKPAENGLQKVIVRFQNRKSKTRVLINAKNLRRTGIYINEHLTKKNGELAKKARDLRKDGKITGTWTRDCKIFIKTNDGTVQLMRNATDLDAYY